MKYSGYIIGLWLIICFLSSCEKDIQIELNNQPDKLVLYSFIYPDSTFKVHLSKSQSILSLESYKLVKNGRFRLSVNNLDQGTYLLPSDTIWSTWKEFNFHSGDLVNIECYEKDGDTVRSSTYIPFPVQINRFDTISGTKRLADGNNEYFLECLLRLYDPLGSEDYYQLHVVRESWEQEGGTTRYNRRVINFQKDDPVFFQSDQSGNLLQGLDFQGLFNDQLFNGSSRIIRFSIPEDDLLLGFYEQKVQITIYLYHLTYDYYAYFKTKIMSEGYQGLPIFDPVQVYHNVDGGVGVFSGLNFDADSLVFVK